MLPENTRMFREAGEAPDVVRRQRALNSDIMQQIALRLREKPPRALVTLARGSSDHAATFARYLVERHVGILTSSASPSMASVYDATPDLGGTALLAISQSGQSPDLLAAAKQARTKGAFVIAAVNVEDSPLAAVADAVIPLRAGPEVSVAASKSFIASLSAIVDLVAAWTGERAIDSAIADLPDKLREAWALDWTPLEAVLAKARHLYVVARGHGFGVAQEAALKLKETCGLHAEAFSAAEVRHGPMALVDRDFPVLLLAQADASLDSVAELALEFAARGACVMSAGIPDAPGIALPFVEADPLIAPILQIASLYRAANAAAIARGRNPDRPPHLAKVTETV